MILCGASAYPRVIDFAKFREIADDVGAILMADMAHISGLVATGLHPSPFEHCDIVTTTTHKTLRGPRAGMIFFKYGGKFPDIKERIDMAVFPALQGGPHNHQICALAAQLLEVASPAFADYAKAVVANAATLAESLKAKGHKLASGGTDNHLVLWDLRPLGLTGSKLEKVCDLASISLNKNTVPGDASALSPGGVRIGTPAMTTRGCTTDDFKGRGVPGQVLPDRPQDPGGEGQEAQGLRGWAQGERRARGPQEGRAGLRLRVRLPRPLRRRGARATSDGGRARSQGGGSSRNFLAGPPLGCAAAEACSPPLALACRRRRPRAGAQHWGQARGGGSLPP